MLEGGVPILKDGQCIGAVGVSGVKSSEDAQIAKAGIAASVCDPGKNAWLTGPWGPLAGKKRRSGRVSVPGSPHDEPVKWPGRAAHLVRMSLPWRVVCRR
jgi:hypothetical protein